MPFESFFENLELIGMGLAGLATVISLLHVTRSEICEKDLPNSKNNNNQAKLKR